MPSIPLPFVVSLVLCLILVRMIRQGPERLGLFPLLIAVMAVQAILSGLNWSIGWPPARFVQPIIAAVPPALCFCAFSQLHHRVSTSTSRLWPHLLPAAVVGVCVAFWRSPIDALLFSIYLGYGLALLRVASLGPYALASVRLSDEWTAHKTLVAVAMLLVLTAFVDATVSLDLTFGNGQQARTVLTIASVMWLAVAGYAATIADNTRPHLEPDPADDMSTVKIVLSEDDAAILHRVNLLMNDQHLYRDPDLTLDRLSRRAGIPARQISAALNRVHGRNVSQIVNEYRVGDARRRLVETSDTVTTVMLESGFGTKSNFNREFLRVTGMTPSAYRRNASDMSA